MISWHGNHGTANYGISWCSNMYFKLIQVYCLFIFPFKEVNTSFIIYLIKKFHKIFIKHNKKKQSNLTVGNEVIIEKK